jgi:hypothetical protein
MTTFTDVLLNEVTLEVDPNDDTALNKVRKSLQVAKRDPSRAARKALQSAQAAMRVAQAKENSPSKSVDVAIARKRFEIAQLTIKKAQVAARESFEGYEGELLEENEAEMILENEILTQDIPATYEELVVFEEGIRRAFKRIANRIKQQFRCTSGRKAGKVVASPNTCATKKDPKRIKAGRKSARLKKSVRIEKTKRAFKKPQTKQLIKMNRRISGHG